MSATLDKFVEEFRALAPEQQQQLLEMLERERLGLERARRAALSRRVRGKYAHLSTDSEKFIALKREETEREDLKFEGRR